ncbi:MAG TPA: hypothetical protein VKU03_00770 [Roseiarcus sp.]|nr:hypothetical protein [Roseiarcus sp.]
MARSGWVQPDLAEISDWSKRPDRRVLRPPRRAAAIWAISGRACYKARMIALSAETEALAERLAAAQRLPVAEAVRLAIEEKARIAGIAPGPSRPRDQTAAAIAARRAALDRFVAEISSMPVRDARSPCEIIDDLNAL